MPDFVVLGHVTQDYVNGVSRPGGAAAYAAVAAHRLGRKVGLLTSTAPELPLQYLPSEIEVVSVPGPATTTFRNDYSPEGRRQAVLALAAPLNLTHVPWAWLDTQVLLLAPVVGEVDSTLIGRFRKSLVGVAAQGWLRRWSEIGGPVSVLGIEALRGLPTVGAVFLSEEDFVGTEEDVVAALERTPIIVVTHGARGARLWWQGQWLEVPAFPASEVDPTGAGDVFAAAYLVRLSETRDPVKAALFASAAASLAVEGEGIQGIPGRVAVEARVASR
ncbi:MAG: ribokinase [Chloroflexi bacterium]|nr:ribokinase [Chloroflexota bacterium]